MDITTLLQTNSVYIIGVAAIFAVLAAWKWYRVHTNKKANRLAVLQMKKFAGNITSDERDYLDGNEKWWAIRRKQTKFSWSGYREIIKNFDIRESLDKLNPLKTIRQLEKQIKELRSDCSSVRRNVNTVRWELSDRIKSVELSLQPEPEEPQEDALESQRNHSRESQLGVASFDGSKFA